jgi:hypothetical protein
MDSFPFLGFVCFVCRFNACSVMRNLFLVLLFTPYWSTARKGAREDTVIGMVCFERGCARVEPDFDPSCIYFSVILQPVLWIGCWR